MQTVIRSIRLKLTLLITLAVGTMAVASSWATYHWSSTAGQVLATQALIALLGAAVSYWVATKFTQRLLQLQQAAQALASGDMEVRVPITTGDEIDQLAAAINRMTEELTESYEKLEERVEERTQELARSNAELEQFAYVASHDLQEPLRKVASFCQLLQQRYQGRLDEDADKFIHYAVDGAMRMKVLVMDLLNYSRVGRQGGSLGSLDAGAAWTTAVQNLEVAIEESGAVVSSDPLPTVMADQRQLIQLFQNLISNAIKYRGERPPEIQVSAAAGDDEWVFAVRDNGIGIPEDSYERIFLIFQRLHGRNEYSGTGIGLAICKKIVDQLGGRIWLESQVGEGTTFYFSIPAEFAPAEPEPDDASPALATA